MLKDIHRFKKKTFKYLIIGSNGLLGSSLQKYLPKTQTFSVARDNSNYNLDLLNFKKLQNLFNIYKFEFVINCAAITNLNYCEKNKKIAWKTNTLLPKKLSDLSKKFRFKYIHISTDHFFSSKKIKYFNENSTLRSFNYYSKTKLSAEKKIINNKDNLIIRTNFTGFKKNNTQATFIGWVLYNIQHKKKIQLFNDMFTSTIDVFFLSKTIFKLVKLNAKGVFNIGAKNCISKKDFAIYFSKLIGKKIRYEEISVKKLKPLRGKCMCLNINKVEKKLRIKMISSKQVIRNLVNQI